MLEKVDIHRDSAAALSPLVSLQGVSKSFANRFRALDDVNMTIRQGEFISLLGPSGCGKSTVLRIVAGLSNPTTGRLDWQRRISNGEIAFVFQEPALLPWASVYDNIWLPLRLQNISRRDADSRIRDMIERVHLTGFEKAVPRELSGGMKMRVSIARGLVTKPRLLLMDEPFAALDEITRSRLNTDLLELWRDQKFTTIFVTHSVFESVFLSTRIAVMAAKPGRVVEDIPIDVEGQRNEAFRMSEEYAVICRKVSNSLSQAIHLNQENSDAIY